MGLSPARMPLSQVTAPHPTTPELTAPLHAPTSCCEVLAVVREGQRHDPRRVACQGGHALGLGRVPHAHLRQSMAGASSPLTTTTTHWRLSSWGGGEEGGAWGCTWGACCERDSSSTHSSTALLLAGWVGRLREG